MKNEINEEKKIFYDLLDNAIEVYLGLKLSENKIEIEKNKAENILLALMNKFCHLATQSDIEKCSIISAFLACLEFYESHNREKKDKDRCKVIKFNRDK